MSVISQQVLLRSFSRSAVERGYSIVSRVVSAYVDADGSIGGVTKGSQGQLYEQQITSSVAGKIRGVCSCPVGLNCKHCVAVLRKIGQLPGSADRVVPLFEKELEPIALDGPAIDSETRQWLRKVKDAASPKIEAAPSAPSQTILFLLSEKTPGYQNRRLYVNVVTVKQLKSGSFGVPKPYKIYQAFAGQFAEYISPDEAVLLTMLYRSSKRLGYSDSVFEIAGIESDRVLGMLLDTGKCRWEEPSGPQLRQGDPRVLKIRWSTNVEGVQKLEFVPEPAGILLRTTPARYLDWETGEIGCLDSGLSSDSMAAILEAPPVKPEAAETVRQALMRSFPGRADLWPEVVHAPEVLQITPVPILVIEDQTGVQYSPLALGQKIPRRFPTLRVYFQYGDERIDFEDERSKISFSADGEARLYARNIHFEVEADRRLRQLGLVKSLSTGTYTRFNSKHDSDFVVPIGKLPDDDIVRREVTFDFLTEKRSILEAEGWRIEVGKGLLLYEQTPDFQIDLEESGMDWFSVSLGFEVDGEKVDLLPILVDAIRRMRADGSLNADGAVDSARTFYHRLKDGRYVPLPTERIAPLVKTIFEWYGNDAKLKGKLVLDRYRAADLAELDAAWDGVKWQGSERLREMGRKLADVGHVAPLTPPKKLIGSLRPYQAQGLAWLQLLREFGFGAILADDMGLGKTIQTIAHILLEKEQGRLDKPVLIVAPTSTLPNWLAELAQFGPSLKVAYAQGADRKKVLGSLKKADVVLTTYPLLARDRDALKATEYHIMVLDEAQFIKNSKTTAWQAARELVARHRICLTGTPMENHLGELWSLFEFLMPGFLGGSEQFKRRFRTPIESHRSEAARDRLAQMVRPFLLRRTKEGVAKELPPKTEVLERVELVGAQRDLYESLRLAMSKRVRDEIASKGLARSQIIVLDALLKLRQACCDPRLVKADSAREVTESAKLDRLIELLEELRSEGRQTLVFSQFTTMLSLIGNKLNELGIEFVTITGDTKDRATPVKRFQKGEVGVFLISLKAGGTGLNLTAAETVIHYDPWWNPAVERQATDRAHRIGQTKPVFVHKLVATDTVEERILELQTKKADLANALLEGSENAKIALSSDDIELFFGA